MKLLSWGKSKVLEQVSVSAGRKHSSLSRLNQSCSAALCVWHPTAAQSINSQSTPSHTHPVRAEQACVRQSLFPILLMQSLNAVLMSGIDRQVCKWNQRRACLCYKTWWPSSTMNPTTSVVLLQSGWQCCEVKPPHPPTQQIHLFAFWRNEHDSFFTKESAVCWQYTHTASPPWALICTLPSKQTWKWAQPAPSKDIPSKLLNCHTQLVFTRTLQELYYWQSFLKQCPCHKPSWRFASTLGTLTKQSDFSSVLSTFLGTTAMPHQHSSVCIQRKHWQHWMQHIFWCLMSLCSWPPAGLEFLWSCQEAAGNNTTNQKPPVNQWITLLT